MIIMMVVDKKKSNVMIASVRLHYLSHDDIISFQGRQGKDGAW